MCDFSLANFYTLRVSRCLFKSGFKFLGCLLLDWMICSFIHIHGAFLIQVKIYANASRRRILLAYDCPDYSDRLCTNGNNTLLHVLPMSSLRVEVKFCAVTFLISKFYVFVIIIFCYPIIHQSCFCCYIIRLWRNIIIHH
jgi:hypothetical protein